jgi:hypothetical protein
MGARFSCFAEQLPISHRVELSGQRRTIAKVELQGDRPCKQRSLNDVEAQLLKAIAQQKLLIPSARAHDGRRIPEAPEVECVRRRRNASADGDDAGIHGAVPDRPGPGRIEIACRREIASSMGQAIPARRRSSPESDRSTRAMSTPVRLARGIRDCGGDIPRQNPVGQPGAMANRPQCRANRVGRKQGGCLSSAHRPMSAPLRYVRRDKMRWPPHMT